MAEKGDSLTSHLNITKHCLAADYYADLCPSVSRFCMKRVNQMKKTEGIALTPAQVCCKFCDSVYRPGNYKVKIVPKMKLSAKIQKLSRKVSTKGEQSLGKFQKKLLNNFKTSRTKVVMICGCCKKKTVIPCPQKPDKLVTVPDMLDQKPKQSKKKLKQKRRRRANLEDEDFGLTAKHSTSSAIKRVRDVSSETRITAHKQSAKAEQRLSSASFQRSLQTDSNNTPLKKSKNKTKPKDVHKTLQRMLQKDKQENTATKSSLHSFLSSL